MNLDVLNKAVSDTFGVADSLYNEYCVVKKDWNCKDCILNSCPARCPISTLYSQHALLKKIRDEHIEKTKLSE